MGDLKQKVIKGTFWMLLERFSTQLVTFVIGVVLARLLSPSDYGTVALLSIFTSVAGVLVDSGLGTALIQKKDATDLDFNSVFYLSIAISIVLYVILFTIAPNVACFYNIPELCPILRTLSVVLFFNSVNSVQNAELNRKLLFHLSFRISLISTITSAVVGLTLALSGCGVWTLVWSTVSAGFVGMISRWWIIAWRPRLMFSWLALKPLFCYGWKMAASALTWNISNSLYGLVIGKLYSRDDLSFVNRGNRLPELVMSNINGALGRVAFPALTKIQTDRIKMLETIRRMIIVSTFLVFPLMTVFAVTAKTIVLFLFGEKWLSAAPYAIIACFPAALESFNAINNRGIQAMGRSDIVLRITLINRAIGLIILVVFLSKSVWSWCLAMAFVSSPMLLLLNAWPNRKLLNYTLRMQVLDVLPTILICGVVLIPIMAMNYIPISSQLARIFMLSSQWFFAFLLFVGLAVLFRLRGLREICLIVRPRVLAKIPSLAPLFCYLEKSPR